MHALLVVNSPKAWPFQIPDVEVIAARRYLTDSEFSERRGVQVFNLCRSYRYQSLGYYVSLLAAARGHKPVPSVSTIQDLKSSEIVRIQSDELDELIQRSLKSITSKQFVLSIYFGRNLAKRYDRLALKLFQLFYAPLLRVTFAKGREGRWTLQSVQPISTDEISESHRGFVLDVAMGYFAGKRWSQPKRKVSRWDIAILVNPIEVEPPSDKGALKRFVRAAQTLGMSATFIDKEEYANLAEFDALFIREMTAVHHHTYRFARRAMAEGMVVMDDPDSILRCTNKVYLHELLDRHRVATPKTMIVHRDNLESVPDVLGLPCILKKPDSAFSQGVLKVHSVQELRDQAEALLSKSELIIAQQFVPTEFDWRIGVIDGEALWCSKYYMAPNHWQIIKTEGTTRQNGHVETVALHEAPPSVVKAALRACSLIGRGLYGVDVKVVGKKTVVIEVNDNPSIEAGFEDAVLKDELYERIMGVFLKRLEARRQRLERPWSR